MGRISISERSENHKEEKMKETEACSSDLSFVLSRGLVTRWVVGYRYKKNEGMVSLVEAEAEQVCRPKFKRGNAGKGDQNSPRLLVSHHLT